MMRKVCVAGLLVLLVGMVALSSTIVYLFTEDFPGDRWRRLSV